MLNVKQLPKILSYMSEDRDFFSFLSLFSFSEVPSLKYLTWAHHVWSMIRGKLWVSWILPSKLIFLQSLSLRSQAYTIKWGCKGRMGLKNNLIWALFFNKAKTNVPPLFLKEIQGPLHKKKKKKAKLLTEYLCARYLGTRMIKTDTTPVLV